MDIEKEAVFGSWSTSSTTGKLGEAATVSELLRGVNVNLLDNVSRRLKCKYLHQHHQNLVLCCMTGHMVYTIELRHPPLSRVKDK